MTDQKIHWTLNNMQCGFGGRTDIMSAASVEAARDFHRSIPGYAPTPLLQLDALAAHLGLGAIFVKDESKRFGLNSFKSLGASFAIARHIETETGRKTADCDFGLLTSLQLKEELDPITFYAATDGNHGRGLAWSARQLGQKAVIRMPKGSTQARKAAIEAEGAEVSIEELNYDDCVRLAARQAAKAQHGVLVQDTAWDGYELIPSWIMQGYGTLSLEAAEQLEAMGEAGPTHIIVQAGVGSLASSVIAYFANRYPERTPRFVVVEAASADCLFQSIVAGDGRPRIVSGDLDTIMAGLSCGEPSSISWEILHRHADAFATCPDHVAKLGMRILASPRGTDKPMVSGESGAVGIGALALIMRDSPYKELRRALGLGIGSRVLLISTEGDTDPDRYRSIVGDGAWQPE